MCAIMGYTGTDLSREQLEGCFQRLKSRGPDDSRTLQVPGGTLLFHRLAIMGPDSTGMQPFTAPDGSAVVCNGELYGFRKMKKQLEEKGYQFQSGSDCELLLPLWREYGTEMFSLLDAEFALVLYDAPSASFIAARDPIGIRPLYYGYSQSGHILFASEPKALMGLAAGKVTPFPPRALLQGRTVRLLPGHDPGGEGLPRQPGRGLPEHPGAADPGGGQAAGRGRAGGLPPLRRAGQLPGVRHRRPAPGPSH